MRSQRALRLTVTSHGLETEILPRILPEPEPIRHFTPAKRLADLLKRQARAVMRDITTSAPEFIGVHVQRLDALREVIQHVLRYDLNETPESALSGNQLQFAATLADFLTCLEYTRKEHRMPCGFSVAPDDVAGLHRKLDLIAGLLASPQQAARIFADVADNESVSEMLVAEHEKWGRL